MAANNDKPKPTIVEVVDVRREGKQLILPEGMEYDRAIDILTRQRDYEQQTVDIVSPIDAMPQEGGYALLTVLNREFGYAQARSTMRERPATIEVKISPTETVSVPWGNFEVPSIDGWIGCDVGMRNDGRLIFQISAHVKRKHEKIVQELVAMVREEVRLHSIYKGRAWRIRLKDDRDRQLPMPEPIFLDLNPLLEQQLTFPADVQAALEVNLWNHIEYTPAMRAVGNPLKRGVLFIGDFGTGKSMSANVTAIKAVRNGWTYIVADRADELAEVARMARDYGPTVLFCEDVDRVTAGQRSINMDELLNVIDGIESKNAELIVVLTTNDLDSIHEAMLRPGRIDAAITLRHPDAPAAEKLLRVYSGALLPADEDISEAAELISGEKTSAVREVADRAKSAAVGLSGGQVPEALTGADLHQAALSVVNQLSGLRKKEVDESSNLEKAAHIVARALMGGQPYGQGVAAEPVKAITTEVQDEATDA